MDGNLWNIGMKAPDMDAEEAFWKQLGGRTRVREVISVDRPEGKADLDIQVRGLVTHGRVALLVNHLVDPLRRVPLDWSIEWCIGFGAKTGPLSDFAIRWNQMH